MITSILLSIFALIVACGMFKLNQRSPKNVKGVIHWKNGKMSKTYDTFATYRDFEVWKDYTYRGPKGHLIQKITWETTKN